MGIGFASCTCPYCGEAVTIAIDASAGEQSYVEDCQVCCRPMVLMVTVDASGVPAAHARREDD